MFGERAHVRVCRPRRRTRGVDPVRRSSSAGIQVTSRPADRRRRSRTCSSISLPEGGRTEVSPSMPTETTGHACKRVLTPDSGRIGARTASGRSAGAAASDADARGRDCAEDWRTASGSRSSRRGRRPPRRSRHGRAAERLPVVVVARRLHAHQPRRRRSSIAQPGRRRRSSIPTFPTTIGRGSTCSGRSTPAAGSTRSSAPRAPSAKPPARTSQRRAPICGSRSRARSGRS